ncbi:hypothetical protein [Umezawaea sp.]|uniref:hypothetical protein n=1 Tax=Umezawaea sp. TaxID=1955258 RepID=UPI002ED65ABF
MHVIVKATIAASALVLAAIGIRIAQDASTTAPPPPTAAAPPSTTSATTPARRPCGTVLTEDASSLPLDQTTLTLVRSIHDAACRHDHDDLVLLMEPRFGGGTAHEAIAGTLAATPEGAAFDTLAAVLGTAAEGGQGGITYCTPRGDFASFDRGTITRPGGWSDFGMARGENAPCR